MKVESEPGRWKHISKDNLREMLDFSHWSKGNEKFVLKVRDLLILEALDSGYHVIVDDTNLHSKHEKRIRELVKGKAKVEIKDFTHVSVKDCIANDLKRSRSVGEKVIREMYDKFLKPKPADPPEYDPNLPDCIICDLDGCLALGIEAGHRGPYDWHKVGDDEVDKAVREVVWRFIEGYTVIFMSGRDGSCEKQTLKWLRERAAIPYEPINLFMREAGDNRKDSIVKRELYEQYVKGKYNVLFVLDDRDQVVQMWRNELGLKCLQVAEGNF